jgi:hypothetical protein
MHKRFLVALLAVVLAGVLLPASASAQPPPYLTQWGTNTGALCGVAVDGSGHVYAAGRDIEKFGSSGTYITRWGTGSGAFGVAVDGSGNVYAAEGANNRIEKFTSNGVYLTSWGLLGTGDGQFNGPSGVAVDGNGYVYVADENNQRIQKFTSDGVYLTQWGTQGSGNGQFQRPTGVAVDGNGNVYVTDRNNSRIQVFGVPPTATQSTTVDFSGISSALVSSPGGQDFTYVLGPGPTTGILNVRLISGDATGGITTGGGPDPHGIYILQLAGALTPRGVLITSNETLTAHETNTFSFASGGSPWLVLGSSDATVNNTGAQVAFVGVNDSPPYGQFAVSAAAVSFDFLVSNAPGWPYYGSALSLEVVDRTVPAQSTSWGRIKSLYR